ncbi:hypothetical protein ENUP19_0061G0088 [Entamoeba nuttalli]|uniref:DNA repair and recombination protein RAD52, putative n=2 Tax=Entamoeba nuttalli TaxID=412467 RepID=K2GS70_ENTNP|nr:DNA repair and recombination protein RAD52, putative [Entamoeba nuttalli P19]EKE37848.1 DNA repair and recombination protein RAD52, putative [Entamoeba nuttalli P19]|eukprot:XP_008859820.1 DNA repair and recombination protein RAD52, putative [Entamoeba nuttalli P19]
MTETDTSNGFGNRTFERPEQIQQMLEQKVPVDFVSVRPGPSNMKLTYLESWKAVELSNALFGFDGWSCCITNLNVDYVDVDKGKFKVGVTAVIRVTLKNGVYHEDVGVGMSEMPKKGMAIELAKKEAVSDGRKRALRLFGNYLGNSLYDTDYVRTLDTNHKTNDTNPLTFNSIRNINKEVFETQKSISTNFSIASSSVSHLSNNQPLTPVVQEQTQSLKSTTADVSSHSVDMDIDDSIFNYI